MWEQEESVGPLTPWAENGVVGASYEVKMIRERPYVQSDTVFMNRHLIKGFDTPFRSQLPDSVEGWTNKGAENHFLQFMVHMSVLCCSWGLEYGWFSLCASILS